MQRVILGGVLGGLVLFVWGAISHMALPLGHAGIGTMNAEREPQVLEAMRGAMSERLIYMFPGGDTQNMSPAELGEWQRRNAAGPSGLVVFDPGPGAELGGLTLGTELLSNILLCLLVSVFVMHLAPGLGYGTKVLLISMMGLATVLSIEASYWNWYRFPTSYFVAQAVDGVVGAFLAGLVIAKVVRSRG